jgi:hypothetical protein
VVRATTIDDSGLQLAGPTVDRVRTQRLGRAWATLLSRRGVARSPVVLARADNGEQALAARDAVVRGLVQSGRDVIDRRRVDGSTFLATLTAPSAGVLVAQNDAGCRFRFVLDGRLVDSSALEELHRIADDGVFVVGMGRLLLAEAHGPASPAADRGRDAHHSLAVTSDNESPDEVGRAGHGS